MSSDIDTCPWVGTTGMELLAQSWHIEREGPGGRGPAWPVAAVSLRPGLAWHTGGAQNPLPVSGVSSAQRVAASLVLLLSKGQQQKRWTLKGVAIS